MQDVAARPTTRGGTRGGRGVGAAARGKYLTRRHCSFSASSSHHARASTEFDRGHVIGDAAGLSGRPPMNAARDPAVAVDRRNRDLSVRRGEKKNGASPFSAQGESRSQNTRAVVVSWRYSARSRYSAP